MEFLTSYFSLVYTRKRLKW